VRKEGCRSPASGETWGGARSEPRGAGADESGEASRRAPQEEPSAQAMPDTPKTPRERPPTSPISPRPKPDRGPPTKASFRLRCRSVAEKYAPSYATRSPAGAPLDGATSRAPHHEQRGGLAGVVLLSGTVITGAPLHGGGATSERATAGWRLSRPLPSRTAVLSHDMSSLIVVESEGRMIRREERNAR
jgi:hypothetical protein